MDILPLISEVTRMFIPTAPKRQKVAFAMEKGGVVDLPQAMEGITVGLGWDASSGDEVDLDVSAVLIDASCAEVETVFFGRLESVEHGIVHSGDNLTGEGDGDDEQITVNLPKIGPKVDQVVFVINIYTAGQTFRMVDNPYARVIDNASGSELCRYMLSEAGSDNGLVVAKLAREVGGRWGFHALGIPCVGRTYKDSIRHIQQLVMQKTGAYMARGGTLDLSGYPSASVGAGGYPSASVGAGSSARAGPPSGSGGIHPPSDYVNPDMAYPGAGPPSGLPASGGHPGGYPSASAPPVAEFVTEPLVGGSGRKKGGSRESCVLQ